jgi:hypothetical protein
MRKAFIWIVVIVLIASLIVPGIISLLQTNVSAPENPSLGSGEIYS